MAATPFWDVQNKGASMDFDRASLRLGDKEYRLKVDPSNEAATITLDIKAGKTTLESCFWLKNGQKTTAFFTDIALKK
jgi:hypothetical protein